MVQTVFDSQTNNYLNDNFLNGLFARVILLRIVIEFNYFYSMFIEFKEKLPFMKKKSEFL